MGGAIDIVFGKNKLPHHPPPPSKSANIDLIKVDFPFLPLINQFVI